MQLLRRQSRLWLLVVLLVAVSGYSVFAQEATQETSGETITITGQVTNGTASGTVPPNLELTLFVIAPDATQEFQTTADENGAYTFADVPLQPTSNYVVTTVYRDRIFTTPLTLGSTLSSNPATLSVAIYELTEDPAVIQIAGMVTQVNVSGDNLEVAQVFSITNSSDRAFTSSQPSSDGRFVSLVIPLPPGAIVAGFPEQGRYIFAQEDFTVLDTAPVLPGDEHIVQLIYFISYNDDAIIEQELSYPVNGPVRLLVRPENVRVTSDQLESHGPEVIGSNQYASYGAELNLSSGSVISFELSGQGGASSTAPISEAVVSSDNFLPIALGLLVVTVIVAVAVLFVYSNRRRQLPIEGDSPAPSQTLPRRRGALARETQLIDILLEQIAELDSDFEAGKIDKPSYDRQRKALKARLSELMRGKQE